MPFSLRTKFPEIRSRLGILATLRRHCVTGILRHNTTTGSIMSISRKLFLPLLTASLLFSACDSGSEDDSELSITDLKIGDGEAVQTKTTIIISWEGRLPDGTVFDSSELRGLDLIFTLGVGKVIAGLDEGILGMHVGGKRRIEIPPQKAFGRSGSCLEDGACPVPGNTTVTYEVEVLSIMTEVAIDEREEGEGVAAKTGDKIWVEYIGASQAGIVFDSSEQHGGPLEFTLGAGQVIEGWDRGITGMKIGGVRILTIPPMLAYGSNSNGPITPWSVIIFRVELVAIIDQG